MADGRQPLDRLNLDPAFRPIGIVAAPGGTGTAFMVAPCYALTARHNVIDRSGGKDAVLSGLRMGVGAYSPQGASVGGVTFEEAFDVEVVDYPKLGFGGEHTDWAVLQVRDCRPGLVKSGWLRPYFVSMNVDRNFSQPEPEQNPDGIYIAGFPGEHRYGEPAPTLFIQRCSLKRWDRPHVSDYSRAHVYEADCQVSPGNSGAPAFRVTPEGLQVFGVVSTRRGGSRQQDHGARAGVDPLTAVSHDSTWKIIREARAAGTANPAAVPVRAGSIR